MQSILLPIKPKFCEKILSGEKRVEFRKRGFKREVTHVVMYATATVSMIVGWFEVNFIYEGNLITTWVTHGHEAGISYDFYSDYYKNHNKAVVIGIKNPVKIEPLSLSSLNINNPPQNFYYLNDEQFGRVIL